MAGKIYNLEFFERNAAQLALNELEAVQGGYIEVPAGAGSMGGLNWSEIDVREELPLVGGNIDLMRVLP